MGSIIEWVFLLFGLPEIVCAFTFVFYFTILCVCVCYVVVAVVVGAFCPESVVRLFATADREQYLTGNDCRYAAMFLLLHFSCNYTHLASSGFVLVMSFEFRYVSE